MFVLNFVKFMSCRKKTCNIDKIDQFADGEY